MQLDDRNGMDSHGGTRLYVPPDNAPWRRQGRFRDTSGHPTTPVPDPDHSTFSQFTE